ADSGTVHCCDDRFFGAEQAVALDIQGRNAQPRLVGTAPLRVERRAVAKIGPRAERFALRRQYDGADVAVSFEALESARNVLDQRNIEEVVWRPPDLDQNDVAGFFDADITHAICPLLGRRVPFRRVRGALYDQGIHYSDTVALAVHDHRIEINFGDVF